jgi:RNA polymerase sigma-70 factor (ECF subfamily)
MIHWFKQKIDAIQDAGLIKKIQEGRSELFGELYKRYVDSIYRYIFFRVNQDRFAAEDLTQVTFQKSLISILQYDTQKGSYQSWIFRIAHNVVIDFYRKQSKSERLHDMHEASHISLEEKLDVQIQFATVQEALNSLTSEQREVLILRFIEDMTPAEIARILDKDEAAIRSLQYRGLQQLRKRVKKRKKL